MIARVTYDLVGAWENSIIEIHNPPANVDDVTPEWLQRNSTKWYVEDVKNSGSDGVKNITIDWVEE